MPSRQLLSLGFGATDPRTFIYSSNIERYGATGFMVNTVLANLPQLVLSGIYFTYNGLFTCFMVASEWNQFSQTRKGLRVSTNPRGAQRTTYFLQLPYRISLPLIAVSGILHWLCSQSLFLVSVSVNARARQEYFNEPTPVDPLDTMVFDFTSCGYSPRAIIVTIVVSALMLLAALGVGRKRFKTAMPISSTCSASISAMCHLPKSENREDAALHPVKWGVTSFDGISADGSRFGHCSFSTRAVQAPEDGQLYAG
jgi:hypothetical protein